MRCVCWKHCAEHSSRSGASNADTTSTALSSLWLADDAMIASARNGLRFVGRLCHLQHFTMTNGVAVPVVGALMEQMIAEAMARGSIDLEHASGTTNFAAGIYRAALDDQIVGRVLFR
jgi:hypothetical protein